MNKAKKAFPNKPQPSTSRIGVNRNSIAIKRKTNQVGLNKAAIPCLKKTNALKPRVAPQITEKKSPQASMESRDSTPINTWQEYCNKYLPKCSSSKRSNRKKQALQANYTDKLEWADYIKQFGGTVLEKFAAPSSTKKDVLSARKVNESIYKSANSKTKATIGTRIGNQGVANLRKPNESVKSKNNVLFRNESSSKIPKFQVPAASSEENKFASKRQLCFGSNKIIKKAKSIRNEEASPCDIERLEDSDVSTPSKEFEKLEKECGVASSPNSRFRRLESKLENLSHLMLEIRNEFKELKVLVEGNSKPFRKPLGPANNLRAVALTNAANANEKMTQFTNIYNSFRVGNNVLQTPVTDQKMLQTPKGAKRADSSLSIKLQKQILNLID